MTIRERISAGQLAVIQLNMMAIETVLVPATLLTARRDAWLGAVVLNAGQHLLLFLASALALRLPGMTLVQTCQTILGRFLGSLLALFYLCFFLYNGAAVLRSFTEFLISMILPETPIAAVLILMGLLAAYGVRHGIETMGRISQVILPLLLGWLFFILPLVAQKVRPERLLPILEHGIAPIIRSLPYASLSFAEVPFLVTLATLVGDQSKLRGRLHFALLLHLVVNVTLSALVVAASGLSNAVAANYPVFTLSRNIDVADFIQRIEALFMVVIVMGYFIRAAFYLYATSFTLTELLGLADYRPLVLPLLPLILFLSYLMATSQQHYKSIVLTKVLIPFSWYTGLVIPLILLVIDSLRRGLLPTRSQRRSAP